MPDLEVVVEEADRAHADHEEQQQQAAGGEPRARPGRSGTGGRRGSRRRSPPTMTVPPMVGVPFLARWLSGPSSRISWPRPCRRNARMASGVSRIEMIRPKPAAMRTDFTRRLRGALGAEQVGREHLQPVGAAGLDQDDVARARAAAPAAARAAARSGTCTDSSPATRPAADAPSAMPTASGPTATTRSTPAAAASRPSRSCSAAASGPSSPMAPRTAIRRRAGQPGQRGQGGAHRLGVGVVGVVDDGDAVGAPGDLHAPAAARAGGRQRRGDVGRRHARRERGAGRRQRVGHLVLAHDLQRHRVLLAAGDEGEPRPGGRRRGRRPRRGRRRRRPGRS